MDNGAGEIRARVYRAEQDIAELRRWQQDVVAGFAGLKQEVHFLGQEFERLGDSMHEFTTTFKAEKKEEEKRLLEHQENNRKAVLDTAVHTTGGALAGLILAIIAYLVTGHHP